MFIIAAALRQGSSLLTQNQDTIRSAQREAEGRSSVLYTGDHFHSPGREQTSCNILIFLTSGNGSTLTSSVEASLETHPLLIVHM